MQHSFQSLRRRIDQAIAPLLSGDSNLSNLLAFSIAYDIFRGHDVLAGKKTASQAPRLTSLIVGEQIQARQIVQRSAEAAGLPYVSVSAGEFVAPGYVGLHLADLAQAVHHAAEGQHSQACRAVVHFMGLEAIAKRDFESDVGGVSTQRMILSLLNGIEIWPSKDSQTFRPLTTNGMVFIFSANSDELCDSLRRRERGGFNIDDRRPLAGQIITIDDLNRELKLMRELLEAIPVRVLVPEADPSQFRSRLESGTLFELNGFVDYLQQLLGIPIALHPSTVTALISLASDTEGNPTRITSAMAQYLGMKAGHADPELHCRLEVDGESLEQGHAPWLYPGKSPICATSIDMRSVFTIPSVCDFPSPGVPDVRDWPGERIDAYVNLLRNQIVDQAADTAKLYWEQVEHAWSDRKLLLLQLMIELIARKLTLTELFLAYCHGDTDDLTAILYFALYRRAKRTHEVRKEHGKVAGPVAPQFQPDPDQKPDESQSGEDEDDEDADE